MTSLRPYSRREILVTAATLLTASSSGCSFLQGTSKGATDVVVFNETTTSKSVTVTILAAEDEEPRLATTITIEPGSQVTPTASDKLPVGTDYTIEIDVAEGPTETYNWQDVTLERAPLHVLVKDSGIDFELQSG